MVNFLAKIFIKDYKNTKRESVRTAYGVLAGIFGIISNLILVGIKLTIGFLTISISIIADGINNLSDSCNSVLTLVGYKLANKPGDKDHPFGHQRIEYIISFIIAMAIAFVGVELLRTSISRIIHPEEMKTGLISFILLGVSIVIKIIQGLFYLNSSKKINSLPLKANAKDSLIDVIATSVVLLGAIISPYIGYNLDGALGVGVSIFILITAILMIRETIKPLIGEKPDPKLVKAILRDVKNTEGILGVHDLICHLYGPSKIFITLHCEVDSKMDTLEAHELIDDIEHLMKRKYDVKMVIHIDPIVLDDPEQNKLKEELTNIIKKVGKELKFHDFRIIRGKVKTNLVFDLVVPYKYHLSNSEIGFMINEKVREIDSKYYCTIEYDIDYGI